MTLRGPATIGSSGAPLASVGAGAVGATSGAVFVAHPTPASRATYTVSIEPPGAMVAGTEAG